MISLFIFRTNMRGTRYGIGTYIKQLSLSLVKNTDTTIYLVDYHSSEYKEFTFNSKVSRLHEIHIPTPKTGFGNEKQKQKYASRVIDLLTVFINKELNVVFQVNYPDALPIVRQLKSRFSFPVISVVHSAQWHFIFDGNKQKFIEAWTNNRDTENDKLKPIAEEKELYELSDKIISVTDYMKDFIREYYHISEEKIEVIHNGIDSNVFHIQGKEEKAALKQSLGFSKDERIILFSGRLDASKGIYFLLDAFAKVNKQFDNIRLVLIGEDSGPDKICQFLNHCENIWSKISFTGFLESETVLKFYQVADVGIIPSIYDHCPYVALEMMGHNLPLIISNTEGLNEILKDDQSIYLEPLLDREGNITYNNNEITDAILSVLNNEEKRELLTRDHHELIRTKFSADRMALEMSYVLNCLCAASVETVK
jgi:glycosyltransferase